MAIDRRDERGRWDRRRAEAALAREVRRDAPRILEELAAPLVVAGRARLEVRWDDDAGDEVLALIPADPAAAEVTVWPHGAGVHLRVGPSEHLHEIPAGGADWRAELRDCVEAVIAGRYLEAIMPWPQGRELRMVFETPAGTRIVWHFGDRYAPIGERRFATYY